MGHYSQLYLGHLYLSWKYYIPTFPTLLFQENDWYVEYEPKDDPKELDYISEIGFKTTCAEAIENLEQNGYTIDFFAEVYDFFERDLHEQYTESAEEAIVERAERDLLDMDLDEIFANYLDRFPNLTREQELQDFLKFLRILLSRKFNDPDSAEPVEIELADGRTYRVVPDRYHLAKPYGDAHVIDFEDLQIYLLGRALDFPPWILKLCYLLDWDLFSYYPEVMWLMVVRLALESVAPDAEVKLDLADIILANTHPDDPEKEMRELHVALANSVVDKVNLYSRVFRPLFRQEDQIRERYIKSECRSLLIQCDKANKSSEKGRVLERLVEILFTSNYLLELVDKRVRTTSEEIDLVVKNNIDRPFWNALQSPLFFIECKNWKDPVGADELRNFEGKLRNHAKLAKVGFFVALNGFTADVEDHLKRVGRDELHIVLLERQSIEEYLNTRLDFFTWLETRAAVFY